jgi:hypothetical protein
MDHHAGILQQRIEILSFRRCRDEASERIRRQQQEQQEADGDQSHHRKHARDDRRGKIAREQRHRTGPSREHQQPE